MIQIDIDMPTDCFSCWIRQNMGCKIANESGWLINRRDDKCPLKERDAVEPKTGHWIESKCLDECFWVCSECDFPSEAIAAPKLYKYCPNCGTKMEDKAVKWDG